MKIIIEVADNGVFLSVHDDDPEVRTNKEVFEFDEDNLDELQELHNTISDLIAPMSGRNSEKRIQHKIVHGDKYECKDKKCSICKEEE